MYHAFHFQLDFKKILINIFEIRFPLKKVSMLCIHLTIILAAGLETAFCLELRLSFGFLCPFFYEQSLGTFVLLVRQCIIW